MHGQATLPSSAALEAISALGSLSADTSAQQQVVVIQASFGVPVFATGNTVLQSVLHSSTGAVTVSSMAARGLHINNNRGSELGVTGFISMVQTVNCFASSELSKVQSTILSVLKISALTQAVSKEADLPSRMADISQPPFTLGSDGYRLHPAAAEAAASLQTFVHRGLAERCCRCLRATACDVYLGYGSRRAPSRKQHATATPRRKRMRRSRAILDVAMQNCQGHAVSVVQGMVSEPHEGRPMSDLKFVADWQQISRPAPQLSERYGKFCAVF